jgi:glycosyltransferase involved in cell wall biosynthesis
VFAEARRLTIFRRASPPVRQAPRPRKGFRSIRAFAELCDYPDLQLVVVGDGEQRGAIDMLPRLCVRAFGCWEKCRTGPAYLHRASDIFASPATGAEASASCWSKTALPLVASDIAGYREVARHECEGLLVRPSDPAALAAGVRRLLDNSALAQALSENGFRRSRSFAWGRIIDRLEGVYDGLLEPARRAALTEVVRPIPAVAEGLVGAGARDGEVRPTAVPVSN